MAFRHKEVVTFKNVVICDKCGEEKPLRTTNDHHLGFDGRMNGALGQGYTFKEEDGKFKNYCPKCK